MADVVVFWGDTPIVAEHAGPGAEIAIGDDGKIRSASKARASQRALLVRNDRGRVVVSGAGGIRLELAPGQEAHLFLTEPPGHSVYRRAVGFEAERLTVRVASSSPAPPHCQRAPLLARRTGVAIAAAATVHALALAAAAATMPELVAEPEWEVIPFRPAPPTGDRNDDRASPPPEEDGDEDEGQSAGDLQLCGAEVGPIVGRSIAVEGPADNPDPHLANRRRPRAAGWPPPIGLQPVPLGGDPVAPIAPWGRDDSLGNHRSSAMGALPGPVSREMAACFGEPRTPWSCEEQLPVPPSAARLGLAGIGDESVLALDLEPWRRPPRVTVGPIEVAANVPRWVVVSVVRQLTEAARSCYQRALADHVLSSGALEAVLRVRGDDTSVELEARGGAIDVPALACCVERSHDMVPYDLPVGTRATLRYTFGFGSWEHAVTAERSSPRSANDPREAPLTAR